MRWYVSRAGQTVGPVEESQLAEWVRGGMFDAYVRDEAGGAWMPVAQSPFASLIPAQPTYAPPAAQPGSPRPGPAALDPEEQRRRAKRDYYVVVAIFALGALGAASKGPWPLGVGLGIAVLGWTAFAVRKGGRGPAGIVLRRSSPAPWVHAIGFGYGALTVAACAAPAVSEFYAGVVARREASAQEAAYAASQKRAAEELARLKAATVSASRDWRSSAASAWDAASKNFDRLRDSTRTVAEIRDRATAAISKLGDEVPQEVTAAAAEVAVVHQRLRATCELEDLTTSVDSDLATARDCATKRQWIGADEAAADGLTKLDKFAAADLPLKHFLEERLQPDARRRDLVAVRKQVAGPAAIERRRMAAEEARQRVEADRRRAQEAEDGAYAAACGKKPAIGGWDGELVGLESALQRTAHDPDSIDVENCTDPVLTSRNCWVSTCDVRGRNAFGAKVLQRKTFSYSSATGYQTLDE